MLMSLQSGCLYLELRNEVAVLLSCFVLGFLTLRLLRFPVRSAKLGKQNTLSKATESPLVLQLESHELVGLPHEIVAQVARCLSLHDFAAVSAASKTTWERFGSSPELWQLLAADHDLDVNVNTVAYKALYHTELVHSTSTSVTFGCELRQAFRRSFFRVDVQRLYCLLAEAPGVGGLGHLAVLQEGAHILHGLMPRDGTEPLERTCLACEWALQAHNPASKNAAFAATSFLQAAHHRSDIIDAVEVERLEAAYNSALQLQTLMDDAVDESFEEMTMVSSEAPTPPNSSPRLPMIALPTSSPLIERFALGEQVLEDMQEEQRHCELDALLEKLQLATEQITVDS